MPDLLLPTYATVLTIPTLALLAFSATSALGERRSRGRADHHVRRRANVGLRNALFLACLALGTTGSLLASGALAASGAALGAVAALALLAGAVTRRLARRPQGRPLARVCGTATWWATFGFLSGLTAQVLVQGGLASAAVLIALVIVAAAKALAGDGALALGPDEAFAPREG